ncbi:exodeoxyribonuclease VII large subunit [Paenibacillus sp. GCM10012307]|uniref:Exodeoxyribonuclease 7 large subunit n=1 Tax=Paenibacillus roseus TaxID=2798579 RepID=A0A934J9X2_9BACL|nr:exodeoxyribonuclease VII large subunit [Paenibacillus roseus]MBJ6364233.1 exodeoxyribonuclease VII large subunit [Paenibacillus roseus]
MADGPRIFSIKEINRYIKMKLESDQVLSDIWLRGEISNFTHHSSGHMYFTLKDASSRLKCVMFASHNQRLPFIPKEGMKVMARGSLSVYERDGNYQFYAHAMQPDGIGSLYLAFEQLKQKLDAEGLFAPERKKPIPLYPKAVGVVTSPTGAAVRDILITLERRFPSVPVLVVPVLVQGTQAAPSIVRAIKLMNRLMEVDVLIVGRGGGSLEELWAFNEESVARSIAESNIPVISAVGHETDYTIADFVADLRAATPTAAAELAVQHSNELRQQIGRLEQRLAQALKGRVKERRHQLERIKRSPLFQQPRRFLMEPAERADRLDERLMTQITRFKERREQRFAALRTRLGAVHPGEQLKYAASRRLAGEQRLVQVMNGNMRARTLELSSRIRSLDALSPLKVMSRGYSLLYTENEQQLVKSAEDVGVGDRVHVKLADGRLECQVLNKER